MLILNEEVLKYAVVGGAILGGGGGGDYRLGLRLGRAALMYNPPKLLDIESIEADTLVVTASAVGAPAAVDGKADPIDYVRALELLSGSVKKDIGGIITNENGATATINGWIQSAVSGIPLIDAPCNGRAHPTGTMGSMGLHNVEGFISYQAAVGGKKELSKYVEIVTSGSLSASAQIVRKAADMAGGLVAVARNPVKASYVKENGAVNGVTHAIETGRAFYKGLGDNPFKAVESVAEFLNGKIYAKGKIEHYSIETKNAFDVGIVKASGFEMTFWNEYMTLDSQDGRLMTFPDLIMTFDAVTGYPVTTANIRKGQEVIIIGTDKANLKLGAGVKDPVLLKEVETVINKSMNL